MSREVVIPAWYIIYVLPNYNEPVNFYARYASREDAERNRKNRAEVHKQNYYFIVEEPERKVEVKTKVKRRMRTFFHKKRNVFITYDLDTYSGRDFPEDWTSHDWETEYEV